MTGPGRPSPTGPPSTAVTGKIPRTALVRKTSSAPRSRSGATKVGSWTSRPAPRARSSTLARVTPSRMPASRPGVCKIPSATRKTLLVAPSAMPPLAAHRMASLADGIPLSRLGDGQHAVQVVPRLHGGVYAARSGTRLLHQLDRDPLLERGRARGAKRLGNDDQERRGGGRRIEVHDAASATGHDHAHPRRRLAPRRGGLPHRLLDAVPRWRVEIDTASGAFEPRQVLGQEDEAPVLPGQGFVDAVAEKKTAIEHRNHGLGRRANLPVDVDTN